jgi:hypothetical protein
MKILCIPSNQGPPAMTNCRLGACRAASAVLLATLTVLPLACGNSNPVRVHPVRGEVYYNGRPAEGAVIHLHPRDKEKGRTAFATINADGSFQLSTFGKNDGAAAGDYLVTIGWWDERKTDEEVVYGPDKMGGRFNNAESSGLTATVKEGKNELARFDLK